MRFIATLFWLLALFAQPALAASSPQMQSFEQQLAALIESQPGSYGVAALDLKSGEMVSVRGDEPFPMASTVKIAVAANYLAQVEFGRRSLDDRIGGRSARSLIEAMMIHSDNHATDILIRDLGGPKTLQSWVDQQGITGLRIDRNIAQLLRSPRDLWDIREFEHAQGDGRAAEPDRQRQAASAGKPLLPARRDEPLPDRQEPDAGAAAELGAGRA